MIFSSFFSIIRRVLLKNALKTVKFFSNELQKDKICKEIRENNLKIYSIKTLKSHFLLKIAQKKVKFYLFSI